MPSLNAQEKPDLTMIGIEGDHVVWLRFGFRGDDWLEVTSKRILRAAKASTDGEQ